MDQKDEDAIVKQVLDGDSRAFAVLVDGHKRKVVARSSEDDYSYGFFNIKVIKVEEDLNMMGVSKITYWANHKFGLVGIEFKLDDNTTAKFPVYNTFEN